MDKKGIQLRGGRKENCTKYFFSHRDQAMYIIMVIESCCINGIAFLSGFIFQDTTVDDKNTMVHPDI